MCCLREIADDQVDHGLDGDNVANATGILACISKSEFIYMMVFLKEILEILKPADKILQSREVGYVEALPVITAVINEVKKLRTTENFEALEKKVLERISQAPIQPKRTLRLTSTEDYETAQRDRIEQRYFTSLDLVLAELNRRFDENDEILQALASAQSMDVDTLKPLAELNIIQMPSEGELIVAKSYLDTARAKDEENESGSERKTILQHLYPVREAFPAVFDLFSAIETFPCSTTISECSFSSLARVGILGRVHMTNERLRNLSFLAFEEKELKKIPSDTILRHFNDAKNRRLQIF